MTNSVTEFTRLTQLLAIGQLALIGATWNLWTTQTDFPQVPLLFLDIDDQPRILDWGLLSLLLTSLITMLLIRHPRISSIASMICGLSTLGLVAIDQHRLQPWAWQFVIVAFVLGLADGQVATLAWRWLIISIYAWSAWSKIDIGFFHGHGRFLIDGFLHAVPIAKGTEFWTESFRTGITAAIPLFELLVAVGLAWPRTRKVSVLGAACMHLFLLLALGPWGHGHQPGVLIVPNPHRDDLGRSNSTTHTPKPTRLPHRLCGHHLASVRIIRILRSLAGMGCLCRQARTSQPLNPCDRACQNPPRIESVSRAGTTTG